MLSGPDGRQQNKSIIRNVLCLVYLKPSASREDAHSCMCVLYVFLFIFYFYKYSVHNKYS